MALCSNCEIRQCFVWTTKLPYYSDETLKSPSFFLRNEKCQLKLSRFGYGGDWHCLQVENVYSYRYYTSVSLERGNIKALTTSGCCGYSQPTSGEVWKYRQDEILKAFPFYQSSNEPFKFTVFFSTTPSNGDEVLVLKLTERDPEKLSNTSEMSTQTSLCLNAVSCLESQSAGLAKLRDAGSCFKSMSADLAKILDAFSCLESLSADLAKLLDEGSNQDVELKCDDQIVKVHKDVLSTRSRVFAAMLRSDMAEGRTGLVEIRDMEPELFQCFVRYIYTGKLPQLTNDTARRLYEAGDKYAVERLTRRCADFLKKNLTPANACEVLVLADAHGDRNFKEDVVAYILKNKIPQQGNHWQVFCDDHPKLAIEVLNRFCNMQREIP